jgi:hypothetical protein
VKGEWGRRLAAAFATLVLACVAAGSVAGCTVRVPGVAQAAPSGSPPPPVGTFTDSEGRFALVPPPEWIVDTSGAEGTEVVFADPQPSGPPTGRLSANINVYVAPAVADLPATVAGAREELRGIADYVSVTDEPVTLADGTAAHMLGGTFTAPGTGLALRNVQLVAVHDGLALVATGTSLQEVWDRYEQTFRTSLRSLTVAT